MYVYKCVSDFRHSFVMGAKKYLIGPGETVQSPTPLTYIFLQQVDDKTPVTLTTPHQAKQVVAQAAVNEVANTVTGVNSDLASVKAKLDDFIDKYESDMQNFTDQMNKHFADIEQKELNNEKEQNTFQEVVNRRMGILKDAVRTIEDEVYGTGEPQSKNS